MQKIGELKSTKTPTRFWIALASVVGLVGVFCLTLAGLTAVSAQMAPEVTFVSNTGQTSTINVTNIVGKESGKQISRAQEFTTGNHATGYTLTGIRVKVAAVQTGADVQVSIYSADDMGNPDESLYELTNPSTVNAGIKTFAAPEDSTLERATMYFVVLENGSTSATKTYDVTRTNSSLEDSGRKANWRIANDRLSRNDGGGWSSSGGSWQIAVRGRENNRPPRFDAAAATRTVVENTLSNMAAIRNVGAPMLATDPDRDTLTYTLEGADKNVFSINSSGQIKTTRTLNFEERARYSVTVKADDGRGSTATITVTIIVSDVDETRTTPTGLVVRPPHSSTTSLIARWQAPQREGGNPVEGYEVQYREGGSGPWTPHAHSGSDTFAQIESLRAGVQYQVRVQALIDGNPAGWTAPATGRVRTQVEDAPSFGTLEAHIYQMEMPGSVPGYHFGETFEVRVRFTSGISIRELVTDFTGPNGEELYTGGDEVLDLVGPDRGISVSAGRVLSIEALHDRHVLKIVVQPLSGEDTILTLEPMRCGEQGALCSSTGLRERVHYAVRYGTQPAAPVDVDTETMELGGEESLRVSCRGSDEATRLRVQWKSPDQDWSEAEEHSRLRSVGPQDRETIQTGINPGLGYDIRVRWENPIYAGTWAYTNRPGLPRQQWGETLIWRLVDGRAEIRIHYDRDLDPNSRLDDAQYLFEVTYSESRTLAFPVTRFC